MISGRMKVFMDDGAEGEVGPGDVMAIPPGHNAEVVGDAMRYPRLGSGSRPRA